MRPTILKGAWAKLAEKYGGPAPLAEAIGVSPRTVLRWANGELEPRGPERLAIAWVAKKKRVESPVVVP
jgi:hypothetical protein